ncbi:MAG TPA: hypothetical protein ENG99_01350 [bacterium]|nr:hypothetical protein [bacterium]
MLNPLIGLVIALGLAVFIYGVVEFIAGADNQEKRDKGKQHIVWGIVGLLIMVAVAGIIQIIQNFWLSIG